MYNNNQCYYDEMKYVLDQNGYDCLDYTSYVVSSDYWEKYLKKNKAKKGIITINFQSINTTLDSLFFIFLKQNHLNARAINPLLILLVSLSELVSDSDSST